MSDLIKELKSVFRGDIKKDVQTRHAYSHDASIYEMVPEAVLFPKDSFDIQRLVTFVNEKKNTYPSLSITPRSAGTDMSGGAIGNSLLIDMTKGFSEIKTVRPDLLHVEPGVFIRDIEPLLEKQGTILGSIPASRAICTIGGMVGNNAGGEQSLRYGNTENSVKQLSVVLSDGNEYSFEPLTKRQLEKKKSQRTFEGYIYREIHELIEKNYDLIRNARPKVNKNSMGYNLWSVWNEEKETFDLTRLISGSQGTLGIITDIQMQPVPKARHSGMIVAYITNTKRLGELIPLVMKHRPAVFEGFDDITFELGIKHFKIFKDQIGVKEWTKQQTSLLGSAMRFKGHLPNMVLMIGFEGETEGQVNKKIAAMQKELSRLKISTEIAGDEANSSRFWQIRRASLSLLRQRIHNKYASPFIDDLTVQPKYLHMFLPELRKIIRKYKLLATTAGHFGDGNFHIIPLMNIESTEAQAKLEPVMREIVPLVLKYHGTLAGEHNDGMVRGPWLPAVFGDEMYQLFRQVKEIFDPRYMFNPHKKTDASWDISMKHIRTSNKGEFIKEEKE